MGDKNWFWIAYAIFALYILNKAFLVINLPAVILANEKWILVITGALLVLAAYRSYQKGKGFS